MQCFFYGPQDIIFTENIYRYGLVMIIGNTYVILVYRHFDTYSIGIWSMIYSQMPIEYVLNYLETKIT